MRLYQLKNDNEWVTQNAVTVEVAERITEVMNGRGRKHGRDYRLMDPVKMGPKKVAVQPARKPRARKATPAAESTQEKGDA